MTDTTSLAMILAALGNETRLALVRRLSLDETYAGPSIIKLTEGSGITRQAITKHLEALERAGLVKRLKLGRATWYGLRIEPVDAAIEALGAISRQQARSQQAFKAAKKRLLG